MPALDLKNSLAQAQKLVDAGRLTDAEAICQHLLRKNKRDLTALRLTGVIEFSRSNNQGAAEIYRQCLTLKPNDPVLLHDYARVMLVMGKYDAALNNFEKVLAINPGNLQAMVDKADVLHRLDKRDAALAMLIPRLESGNDSEGLLVVLLRTVGDSSDLLDRVTKRAEEYVARPPTDPVSRVALLRGLGRLYDRQKEYDKAFNAFAKAHEIMRVPFYPEFHVQNDDAIISMFTRENMRQVPKPSKSSDVPIFIACMPRSGSTLVEQILHAHAQVGAVGEHPFMDYLVRDLQTRIESFQTYPACIADLKQRHLDSIGGEYLTTITKLCPGARRIANKSLGNWRQLGMIQLLFPQARIIHIKRHRIDNGLACYMAGLAAQANPWVADMKNMGFMWREYERVMQHWRANLDIPMLEVSYEELVEHTEREIRRMIDFCGLEWDDQCLRYWEVDRKVLTLSADQVNKPIFKTAVMRYKRYEQFLGPLIEALGEEVV